MKKEELIWVEKEFAERWNALKSERATREQQVDIFNDYIGKTSTSIQQDFRAQLEALDEDAAIFTGLMLKTRQAFEKAKNEHFEASEALWGKFDKEIPSVRKKTDEIIATLTPLVEQLTTINNLLGKIQTYNMDKVSESISRLSEMCGTEREMMDFLVKNFKAKEG